MAEAAKELEDDKFCPICMEVKQSTKPIEHLDKPVGDTSDHKVWLHIHGRQI